MKLIKIFYFFLLIILIPLSELWSMVYRLRRFCYKYDILHSNSFRVPIISVGNLTFGGTGKTPFVIWLSDYLEKMDNKVMVLTRGYKGELENSSGIIKSDRKLGHNPKVFGDEALMLAKKLKSVSVVVGKKRSRNLQYYFESEKPDIVVMDDGHQHLKLNRNLNIVLFDALIPITKYRVAPWGYLREGLTALQDADLVLINRSDLASISQINSLKLLIRPYLNPDVPICEMGYQPTGIFNINFEEAYDVVEMAGKRVICVAGIASPTSFFEMVSGLGAEVVEKMVYPDHYSYTKEDVDQIIAKAKSLDAIIVSTEKDITKLRRLDGAENISFLGIGVYFLKGEEEIASAVNKTVMTRGIGCES